MLCGKSYTKGCTWQQQNAISVCTLAEAPINISDKGGHSDLILKEKSDKVTKLKHVVFFCFFGFFLIFNCYVDM